MRLRTSFFALRSSYFVAFVILCLAVVLNQSAVHWRENLPDDHLFAYYGWRVWHGARPYVDVWDNKPPGIWWVNALGFGACGPGRAREVLTSSIVVLITLLAAVDIVRCVAGRAATLPAALLCSAVLTLLMFECGANRTEVFVAACETAGVACYLRAVRAARGVARPGGTDKRSGGTDKRYSACPCSGTPAWLWCAGVLLGSGVWFKQVGIAAALACGAHLLWVTHIGRAPIMGMKRERLKLSLVFAVALALPSAAGMLLLGAAGALGAAWQAVVIHNQLYFKIGDASWTDMPRSLEMYWSHVQPLRPLVWWIVFGGAAAALYRFFGTGSDRRRRAGRMPARPRGADAPTGAAVFICSAWLLLALYLACVGVGRLAYHLVPVLPPAVVLALLALRWFPAINIGLTTALQRPTATATLLVLGWSAACFWSGNLTQARAICSQKSAWWSLERVATPPDEQQGRAIAAVTEPDDLIYVWGWSPGTYRFAYRANAARFATLEQAAHVTPHGEWMADEVVEQVMQRMPAVFVISEREWRDLGGWKPKLREFVRSHYRLHETIAGMHVFVRER